jgi:hypothetical protein
MPVVLSFPNKDNQNKRTLLSEQGGSYKSATEPVAFPGLESISDYEEKSTGLQQ